MRELDQREVGMVSGGLNPAGAVWGAFGGGVGGGITYAVRESNPTFSGFLSEVAIGTVSGILIGSGASLLVMAWNGTRGAAVVGTVAVGTGFTIQAASGAADRENTSGGSK